MLEEFQTISDGYIEQASVAKHYIELEPCSQRSIHLTPCRAGFRAKNFEIKEVEPILAENVIESARTEWGAVLILAPKKYGSVRIRAAYRKRNAVIVRESYSFPHMDQCIDFL